MIGQPLAGQGILGAAHVRINRVAGAPDHAAAFLGRQGRAVGEHVLDQLQVDAVVGFFHYFVSSY